MFNHITAERVSRPVVEGHTDMFTLNQLLMLIKMKTILKILRYTTAMSQ